MIDLNINIINENRLYVPDKESLMECFTIIAQILKIKEAAINLKIVLNEEIQKINKKFNNKNKPTNIISFEFDRPKGLPKDILKEFLGDIIIAPLVLEKEAIEQNKKLDDHWKHIFVHGLLHLFGYNHLDNREAEQMEKLETKILSELDINNPYYI